MTVDSIKDYLLEVILENHKYLDLNRDDINDFAEIITDRGIYKLRKRSFIDSIKSTRTTRN
jgi:hypothetical protein